MSLTSRRARFLSASPWGSRVLFSLMGVVALTFVVPSASGRSPFSSCYYDSWWGWGDYGWTEYSSVTCEADPWEYHDWPVWEDPPYEEPGGGGQGDQNPHGRDNDLNGWADCAWTVVDQHPDHHRGHNHTPCQVFGASNAIPACSWRGDPPGHRGVDFSAAVGDQVRAIGIGRVVEVGNTTANGNYVRIKHPDDGVSTYIHLKDYSVAVDDVVYPGSPIGSANCTGACSPKPSDPPGAPGSDGSHVHLQLKNASDVVIDPYSKLGNC